MTDDMKNTAEASEASDDSTEQEKKAQEEKKRHDKFVKFVLKNPSAMISLIESYVEFKGLVDDIEPDSIVYFSESTIDNQMKEHISDIVVLYKSKSNPSRKYSFLILIQHQTQPQRFMAFRNVEYITGLIRQLINQQISSKVQNILIPFPIVIIIHQGQTWNYLSMNDLFGKTEHFSSSPIPPLLYLPEFFIDLSKIHTEDYKGIPEVKCLLCAIQSRTIGNLEEQLDFIIRQIKQFESDEYIREFLFAFISYALGITKTDSFQNIIDRLSVIRPKEEVQQMFVSAIDEILAESKAEYEASLKATEANLKATEARLKVEAEARQAEAEARRKAEARAEKAEAELRRLGLLFSA